MCRMIAAVGEFDLGRLTSALRAMADNTNPAHTHEKRPLAEGYRHEDGWGAAWLEGDTLKVRRSMHSCLTDAGIEEIRDLHTDLLVLHARRASRPGTTRIENTHPFLVEHGGRSWAFCHNGAVRDVAHLHPATGLVPMGDMDSELLFHHVLYHLDGADPARSVMSSFDRIQDYTALLTLLTNSDGVIATAKRHPDQGLQEYHALWEGTGSRLHVISSEPLDDIGIDRSAWRKVSDPGTVVLKRR